MLTSRERRVLVALAGGQTATEIAVSFRLSPYTVQNQRRSAYEKLGVGSLIEALNELGWIQVD